MNKIKIVVALLLSIVTMLSMTVFVGADKKNYPTIEVYLADENDEKNDDLLPKNVKVGDKVHFVIQVVNTEDVEGVQLYIIKQKGMTVDTEKNIIVKKSYSSDFEESLKWEETTILYGDNNDTECYCISLEESVTSDIRGSYYLIVPFVLEINEEIDLNEVIGQNVICEYDKAEDSYRAQEYKSKENSCGLVRVLGFTLKVTDKADSTALEGVKFKLTKGEGTDSSPLSYYKSAAHGVFQSDACSVSTDANGNYVFDGLEANTSYTLTQTESKEGYNIYAASVAVKIDSSGEFTFNGESNEANTLEIQLTKTMMPNTGGSGKSIFYIIGSSFIVLALALFCTRKKIFANK